MRYEWVKKDRVIELHKIDTTNIGHPSKPMMWDDYYPVGRLRKVKNKLSCKKFVVDRATLNNGWEYVTLLCMKLDEAKLVAQTLLCAGGQHD